MLKCRYQVFRQGYFLKIKYRCKFTKNNHSDKQRTDIYIIIHHKHTF